MNSERLFALRIDDVPEFPDIRQVENLAKALERNKAKATLAICSGWLRDWQAVQPTIKRLYDEGWADIACHGMYHEDFGGVGMVAQYANFDHYFRPLTLPETHDVLKESQSFAKSFFGDTYKIFVTPGANLTSVFVPKDIATFYEILRINRFKAIAHYPGICGVDPLVRVAKRTPYICEIPFTVYVDFYRRGYFKNAFGPGNYEKYVETTKAYIKARFDQGLFVVLMLHMVNFYPDAIPDAGYPGGDLGGRFVDTITGWIREKYPDVNMVGMSDLIPLAVD